MSNTSNFQQAIKKAQQSALVGPNVVKRALPYVGGGLVLTALGAWGGLGVLEQAPGIFMPTVIVAVVAELALFFVAQSVATQGNNQVALPLLATYSLLSGYTLAGLIALALSTPGVGMVGIGIAALSCGVTFIAARSIGSGLSEEDGFALTQTVQLGIIALVVVLLLQLGLGFFHVITPSWLEIGISGLGVLLFVGAAVVDFFVLPRTYRDEQYLPAALSMYLTYVNLFVFVLRFMISLNSRE
ncbi:Bax inhibitor-1/YccA family protein [Lyngbya confervoides]|uniref:Bax inhibitor-1 family protein n=1 Tax=Lyngbya confervoides BDU141951 TaxID=1574623 RepID=A0ABD4TAG6_9CYAN|nr:Bax inhibitor-1 family protein [Lyngbya confervoides]MCM1985197.1 Bax inhibitor-1 family protein [Lyngbya confervoides BDU141951]